MRTRTLLILLLACSLVAVAACSDDDGTTTDVGVPDSGADGPETDLAEADGPAADGPETDTSGPQQVEAYVSADGEVSGWSEDPTTPGVESGYTKSDIEDLINGKHDPYDAAGTDGFAMQDYVKDFGGGCSATLKLMLWDMVDAAAAQSMFDYEKQHGETSKGLTFETITGVTDAGIIAFDAFYEAHAYKNDYVLTIEAGATTQDCQADLETDVEEWVRQLTGKLP